MNKRKTLVFLCLLFVLISAIILYGVISMKKKNDSAARLAAQRLSGKKNAITLVRESGVPAKGASKIGGIPDLPAGFQWPYFEGTDYEGVRKSRPLSFLAQIDLSQAAGFDPEGLLPHTGMLYFFYELQTMAWGNLEDDGCARVYYYDVSPDALRPTAPPKSLPASLMVPESPLTMQGKVSRTQLGRLCAALRQGAAGAAGNRRRMDAAGPVRNAVGRADVRRLRLHLFLHPKGRSGRAAL